MSGHSFRFRLQENELSSVIAQTIPLETERDKQGGREGGREREKDHVVTSETERQKQRQGGKEGGRERLCCDVRERERRERPCCDVKDRDRDKEGLERERATML